MDPSSASSNARGSFLRVASAAAAARRRRSPPFEFISPYTSGSAPAPPPPPPPPPPSASLAIAAAPNAAATSLAATSQSRAALCANLSALTRDRRAPILRKSASDDAPLCLETFGTCVVSISSHRRTARSKSPRAIASSHDAAHRTASAHARTASMASTVDRSSDAARSNSSIDRSNAPPARATASSCALAAAPRRRMPSLTPSSSRMARVNDAWWTPQIRSTAAAFSRRTHSRASTAVAPDAPTCAPEMTPAAPRASTKRTSGAASSSGPSSRPSPSDPFVDAACASRMAEISSAMRRSARDGRFAVPSASSSSPAASCASLAAAAFDAASSLAALASSSVGFASASDASSCSHSAMVSITNHSCAHCCADIAPSRSTSSLLSHRSRASTVSGRMPPSRTAMRSAMGRARSRRVRRMRRAAPFASRAPL